AAGQQVPDRYTVALQFGEQRVHHTHERVQLGKIRLPGRAIRRVLLHGINGAFGFRLETPEERDLVALDGIPGPLIDAVELLATADQLIREEPIDCGVSQATAEAAAELNERAIP